MKIIFFFTFAGAVAILAASAQAQETSVKPGINSEFRNAKAKDWVERFEKEGREVYDQRDAIIEALDLKPGMAVGDVGTGTGFFARMIAPRLGKNGKLYAVDIAKSFVDHTVLSCHARGWKHVEGVVCAQDDANLPEASVDLVFICDTYHHFEFPLKTMRSIRKALKDGGRVVLVDFERIEGKSSDWILGHVRAGKEVFRQEIEKSGFEFEKEFDFFEENYMLSFRKK